MPAEVVGDGDPAVGDEARDPLDLVLAAGRPRQGAAKVGKGDALCGDGGNEIGLGFG
jgi:hypothetical protein